MADTLLARAGFEQDSSGEVLARDPRTMTPSELIELGHQLKSPLRALRERCLNCCCSSAHEVRYCAAVDCPSWPFRMGKNPWRTPRQMTPEQLEALRNRLEAMRGKADEEDLDDED